MRVRLFGEVDVRVGERRVNLESARAKSLLAFLILHADAPQSRQRIAFLLWPDSTEAQARTNLRHVLHTLRGSASELDGALDATATTLRWKPPTDAAWSIDAIEFVDAVARAEEAGGDVEKEVAALREAVSLYTGDLLDGVYDEWIAEPRDRLRERHAAILRRLSDVSAAAGRTDEAIGYGRELLRADPLREDTYRSLMDLHLAAGDRAGALRVYHQCVSVLERELGVVPSAATTASYARLMADGTGHPQQLPTPAEAPVTSTLVGRDAEWRALTDVWRAAGHGTSALVLITGEPGIGKTRLADEWATWCSQQGAVVANARSYATEGELGYGVLISWLRSEAVAALVARADAATRSELGRVLPELGDDDAVPPGTLADPSAQRHRLFDAFARVLASSARPSVLVADDAQWCDEQSWQLIHYLVRSGADPPVIVGATARREELDADDPLEAVFGQLQVMDLAVELGLHRLDRGDTGTLVRQLAGGAGSAMSGSEAIYETTEGNPLFVVETVRAAAASGASDALPPKLRSVIAMRLRQLSDQGRELVALAATVGREFTTGVLAEAAGKDDAWLVASLDELWRRGIIRELRLDAYDFAHGRIRDVAYLSVSPSVRAAHHRRIATALERFHRGGTALVSGEIARHHDRGGEPEAAIEWYVRAAVEAQRLSANTDAVRLLDRARELVSAVQDGERRSRHELEVLSALSTPLAVVEGFASDRLAVAQARALDLATAAGVEPEASLLRSIAMANLCRRDFEGSRAVAERLRASALRAEDRVLGVESEYLLGIGAFWGGAFDAAREHFERVVADFDPDARDEHLLRFGHQPRMVCHSRLANTLFFLGLPDDARRVRDEAVAMATDDPHPFSLGTVMLFAALVSVDLDDLDGYRRFVGLLPVLSEHQPIRIALESFLGFVDVLDGHTGGVHRIRAAIDSRPVDQAPGQRATHFRLLVAAYEALGDVEGARAAARDALLDGGTRNWEAVHRSALAR